MLDGDGKSATETLLVSTVRVEVTEFGPRVTDAGFSLHGGKGAGPVTEQVRESALAMPPCEANVRTSLARAPCCTVRVGLAGVSEKSGGGLKVAVTDWLEFRVTLHTLGSLPVHDPLQLVKTDVPAGTARRETTVPGR